MQRLRQRDRWRRQQRFHFEQSTHANHSVYIRRGDLDKPVKSDKKYHYRPKTAGHPEIDWALVSFFKDDYYQQTLIAMQGISTMGTFAAAHFLCSPKGIGQCFKILKKNGINLRTELPPFEILLKVHVRGDVFDEAIVEEFVRHDSDRTLSTALSWDT